MKLEIDEICLNPLTKSDIEEITAGGLNDAHMIDIVVRRNGRDEWYEADWIKYLKLAK